MSITSPRAVKQEDCPTFVQWDVDRAAFDDPVNNYTEFVKKEDEMSNNSDSEFDFLSPKPHHPHGLFALKHQPTFQHTAVFETIRNLTASPPCKKQRCRSPNFVDDLSLIRPVNFTHTSHCSCLPPGSISQQHHAVHTKVEFLLRGNGNQPWSVGCPAPPKLGKMRKIIITFFLGAPGSIPAMVRVNTVDKKPGLHESKLVFCTSDRCCERKKRSEPFSCGERQTNMAIPVEIGAAPTEVALYLKPEWHGLGENNTRPVFDVFIQLEINQQIHTLLSWEVSLQSHKYESGPKARAVEQTAVSSVDQIINF